MTTEVFVGRVIEIGVHDWGNGRVAEVTGLDGKGGRVCFLAAGDEFLRLLSFCFSKEADVRAELLRFEGFYGMVRWATKVELAGGKGSGPTGFFVMGIDPGVNGGMALLAEECILYRMPETGRDLWDLLREAKDRSYGMGRELFVFVEEIKPLPNFMRGPVASLKLGVNWGSIRMALIGLGIPFESVLPSKWQRAMGCLSKGNKSVTKARAQELFPRVKVAHWGADALLIAEYGRRVLFSRGGKGND